MDLQLLSVEIQREQVCNKSPYWSSSSSGEDEEEEEEKEEKGREICSGTVHPKITKEKVK